MVNNTVSLKRLDETKPVTRLSKKIRKYECLKRKEMYKRRVKRVEELTDKIKEFSEEVEEIILQLIWKYDADVVRYADLVKKNSEELYDFANDSYFYEYHISEDWKEELK